MDGTVHEDLSPRAGGRVAAIRGDPALAVGAVAARSVKLSVEAKKVRRAAQAAACARGLRPWGWVETISSGPRFQVRRVHVQPGAALPLQSHLHRAEHWVVVQGTARVTVGDTVSLVSENQTIYLPLGEVHRLENPGLMPIVLIEVQTGTYLADDDIIRHEDRDPGPDKT